MDIHAEHDEIARLRKVNSNIPTLVHSSSQRSITASDDYYSVSEASLSQASSEDRTTVIRYHTPIERPGGHSSSAINAYNKSGELAQPDAAIMEHTSADPSHQNAPDEHESKTPVARRSENDLAGAVQLAAPVPADIQYHIPGALGNDSNDLLAPPAASGRVSQQAARSTSSDEPANGNGHHLGHTKAAAAPAATMGAAIVNPAETHASSGQIASHAGSGERAVETPLPEAPGAYPQLAELPGAENTANRAIPRKSVPSKSVAAADLPTRNQSRPNNSPTPDVDDTPYIHFAIDQLTRDEELLGRSRDARGSPDMLPLPPSATAPEVSPMNSDDEKEVMQAQDSHVKPVSGAADMSDHLPEPAVRSLTVSPASAHAAGDQTPRALAANPPPAVTSRLPPEDNRYPALTFIPLSLNIVGIASLVLVCIAFIALLALSMIWSAEKGGLWNYDGIGTGRYFLAEYLPQLVAVILTIYVINAQRALQRILPFVLLASKKPSSDRDIFRTVPLYITNYLVPNASCFQPGEPTLAYAALSFWLHLGTIPLASALYQTRLYAAQDGGWKWSTVQPVAAVLIGLYVNLILALCALHFRLRRQPTGLKWDPESIADILVLLRKSSHGDEDTGFDVEPFRASLGYWESPSQPGRFYHGIGVSPSAERVHIKHGKTVRNSENPPSASRFDSWRSNPSISPRTLKLQPWFFRDAPMSLFAIIATVLMVAFLVVTYRASALTFGFDPLLETATAETSSFVTFSPSNFVFSFVPAVVGLLVPLLWMPIDTMSRVLTIYMSMFHPGPKPRKKGSKEPSSKPPTTRTTRPALEPSVPMDNNAAEEPKSSPYPHLLGTYPHDAPFYATIHALASGRIWVALASLLTMLSWTLPVLGGGIFTAQFVHSVNGGTMGQIVMRAEPGGLSALTVFVVLCAIGWMMAWPATSRLRGGWIHRSKFSSSKKRELEKQMKKGAHAAGDPEREEINRAANAKGLDDACLADALSGHDPRYLAGIFYAFGKEELKSMKWRDPHTRADLTGRIMNLSRVDTNSMKIFGLARPPPSRRGVLSWALL